MQLENRFELAVDVGCRHRVPFSISVSEVQFTPLVLVKNNEPDPLAGTLKLKFTPTPTHLEAGRPTGRCRRYRRRE